jgi:hypothetical protein
MAIKFEVIDVRGTGIQPTVEIDRASSPEGAARQVLGIDVFRSGHNRDLVARVSWHPLGGGANVILLYGKPIVR